MVLLHGFGGTIDFWDPLLRHLDCGTVIAVDLAGFGGSSRDARHYDLSTQADRVVEVLRAMGISGATLVGSSMGGGVAVMAATRHPRAVERLVLFAPAGYPGSLRYDGIRGLLVEEGPANRLGLLLTRLPGLGGVHRESYARQGLSVAASYDSGFVSALERVRQPTLLYWSPGDERVSYAFAERFTSALSDVQLVIRPPDAGHEVARYWPEETAEEICRFAREGA